jgi:hypothetical protein
MLKINYFTDPGHGWAAVKIKILQDLGIADRISHYSYSRGKSAYLEEDCDFAVLLDALAAAGMPYSITEKHTDRHHPIRSYKSYRVT